MENNPIQERLKIILNTLIQYHAHLLQKNTLTTQDPNALVDLTTLLRNEGQKILSFLLYGKYYDKVQDPVLQDTLNKLKEATTPWNSDTSVLSKDWCTMMFIQYPFNISYDHLKNLHKNYGLPIEEDADSSESSSQVSERDGEA